MSEEDNTITETHNTVLAIFNQVKEELGAYPKYDDFHKKFSERINQSFKRTEENRLIHIQHEHVDQELYVDFVVNIIPIKLTNDIHGIGPNIMQGVLLHLSCRIGIIINIVNSREPEFTVIQNQ